MLDSEIKSLQERLEAEIRNNKETRAALIKAHAELQHYKKEYETLCNTHVAVINRFHSFLSTMQQDVLKLVSSIAISDDVKKYVNGELASILGMGKVI